MGEGVEQGDRLLTSRLFVVGFYHVGVAGGRFIFTYETGNTGVVCLKVSF